MLRVSYLRGDLWTVELQPHLDFTQLLILNIL